jgi:poly(glycerol-phosphate) alpha-glucosyltransferase
MALEKPVLITDRCHLPEVASKWGCGLVATDDQAGISEALCGLLRLPDEELRAMGARGRQAVIDNFSWDAVAKKLEHLYENRC